MAGSTSVPPLPDRQMDRQIVFSLCSPSGSLLAKLKAPSSRQFCKYAQSLCAGLCVGRIVSRATEMPPRRASEQPTRAVKRARRANPQEAEQQPATDAPGDLLRGLHFATEHGQRYVELASLLRKVSNKRGDKYLRALWRQLGQDEVAPQIEGVQKLQFAAVAGCARGSQKLAANLLGFQTVVREIEEGMLDRNKELLASVARTLGGEVRLESRHRRVPLDDQAAVLVVMGDPPRMVLTVLVEAFGVAAARNYVERQLIPYFVAGGVRVEGSSGDALQRARLDDPHAMERS